MAAILKKYRKIFLVGCDGLIGKALQNHWSHENLICTSRKTETQAPFKIMWDLTNSIPHLLPEPEDVVVLAAAMTSVEACDKNPKLAHRVNVEAAAEVADLCARQGAQLVFLSSSAVFDGAKAYPAETDAPSPVNEYGRTKAEAENRIQASGAKYLILRLTKVLNPAGGYLASILQSLAQGKKVTASPDLPVAPLSLHWTVEAITRCLDFRESGIFHLSPKGETSYYELAKKSAEMYGYSTTLIGKQKLTDMQKLLPQIPRHAALSSKKAALQLSLTVPMWNAALKYRDT